VYTGLDLDKFAAVWSEVSIRGESIFASADVCSAELEAVVEWKKSGDRPADAAAGCSLAVAAAIRRSRCAPQIRINSLHKLDERPLVCRSEMDVPVTVGDFFDHWVYRSSPALRYRQPSCGLLQRSAVWHIHCSHTPTTDGTECRCSLGRRNRQVRAHHTGATWHSPLAASGRENKIAVLTFDCVRGAGLGLFQASYPSSLWSVMSVTPFCQSRWLVRFAGKHVHRPTKFFYRGSCCMERTSTRPTLTAHQSPTVPIQAENSSVPTSLQHCMIPLRTICWRVKLCNCNCIVTSYQAVVCRLLVRVAG